MSSCKFHNSLRCTIDYNTMRHTQRRCRVSCSHVPNVPNKNQCTLITRGALVVNRGALVHCSLQLCAEAGLQRLCVDVRRTYVHTFNERGDQSAITIEPPQRGSDARVTTARDSSACFAAAADKRENMTRHHVCLLAVAQPHRRRRHNSAVFAR